MIVSFGTRIRQLRKEHDLTLRELAEQVEIDFTYLSKIETGNTPVPAEATIRRLARALNADPEELILLANKLPADFEQDLLDRPERQVAELYRSIAGKRYSDADWKEILELLQERGEPV
jgi:transcriptional regulator with XRE-family HTH domain